MTKKLYYDEPYTLEFELNLTHIEEYDDKYVAFSEETFFYPTSGGQPFDTGKINEANVIEVFEKEGKVFHVIDKKLELGLANASIDYHRRLEHTQHHSGQHLLSQAFIQVLKAPTISFHLGSELATIEIVTKELTQEQVDEVEDFANKIIYENRKVTSLYVSEEDSKDLELRKQPKKKCSSGDIRVIEIENFDMSPCGGTHVNYTGEIGIIKIIGWEKYKGNVRVDFLCGRRALLDYRSKNIAIKNIANKFSTKDKQVEEIILKSIENTKELQKHLSAYKKENTKLLAENLSNQFEMIKDYKLIQADFDSYDMNTLKSIAQEIVLAPNTICLLASSFEKKTSLILACNEKLPLNLNTIAKEIFPLINGKGGGRNNFVQGTGDLTPLKELLSKIRELISL